MSHRQKWSVIAALAIGLSAAALVVSVWPRRPAITFDVPVADSYSLELSFSRSSTIIAITSRLRAGAVKFYDASSGALLSTWERPWWVHWDGGCLGVGEKWIATTWEKHGDDYQVIEVDPRDGTESVLLRRPWSELTLRRSEFDREQHLSDPVAITPDGAMWLHALPKGGVEIWELATGHQIRIVDEHAIKNIAVSPDSKLLAAFARDGVVRVWELRTGKQFTAYPELKEFAEENTSIKINDDG
ncbi:MAG: WD40 repeat domain-containing protein, partial [Planctomycetia bacterium]|nr:WD40 repeat domain-containing protein [Planctomycetia bacterium]